MAIPFFTGTGGSNPIVFPEILPDLNVLILKINAGGAIPMLTAATAIDASVMADVNQLIRLINAGGTIPYFTLGGANPAVLLAAIPDLNKLIELINAAVVTPPSGGPFLLQENGVSKIILEDGSGFLLLEA